MPNKTESYAFTIATKRFVFWIYKRYNMTFQTSKQIGGGKSYMRVQVVVKVDTQTSQGGKKKTFCSKTRACTTWKTTSCGYIAHVSLIIIPERLYHEREAFVSTTFSKAMYCLYKKNSKKGSNSVL